MKRFKFNLRAGHRDFMGVIVEAKDLKEAEEKVKREYSYYGPVVIVDRLTLH